VAFAVYVVVTVGLTLFVPPMAGSVKLLLSEPVTATAVAFYAVTVNVDELPDAIDVGFAEMVTAVAVPAVTVTIADADAVPPFPVAVAV